MTPDEYTIQETFLEVGDGHTLYVHDWGNQHATTPILFLHGGPGGQCKDSHKGQFDPARQRVIFHDQRGSGRSIPYGSLEHNTTAKLVADIETIADHFKLDTFVVTGGSWGSTLSLAYALEHPKRVKALVIHGVWTSRKAENSWLDEGRFRSFFPEAWERYVNSVPAAHRHNPSGYHFPRILGDDPAAAKASGYQYENLEGSAIRLDDRFVADNPDEYDPAGIRIEVNYLTHQCFMPEGYIMDNAHKLTMPLYIVQGRYDMVCPPVTAYELSKAAPQAEISWTLSGHKTEHESWNLMRTILLQIAGD